MNRGVMSPTLNFKPVLHVIPCKIVGIIDYNVAIIVSYQVIFSSDISSLEKVGFWPKDGTHPSSMTIFVHKKCHP